MENCKTQHPTLQKEYKLTLYSYNVQLIFLNIILTLRTETLA